MGDDTRVVGACLEGLGCTEVDAKANGIGITRAILANDGPITSDPGP